MKSLLFETGKVLIVGLVVAWLANRVSPRGLHLGRDYFGDPRPRVAAPESGRPESPSSQPHAAEASHRVSEITSDQALGFFRESRRRPGEVIFVDAVPYTHLSRPTNREVGGAGVRCSRLQQMTTLS